VDTRARPWLSCMWDGSHHKFNSSTVNNSRPLPLVNLTGTVSIVNNHGCTADFGRDASGAPFTDPTITVKVKCKKAGLALET
jgi:hypothetical protein